MLINECFEAYLKTKKQEYVLWFSNKLYSITFNGNYPIRNCKFGLYNIKNGIAVFNYITDEYIIKQLEQNKDWK